MSQKQRGHFCLDPRSGRALSLKRKEVWAGGAGQHVHFLNALSQKSTLDVHLWPGGRIGWPLLCLLSNRCDGLVQQGLE